MRLLKLFAGCLAAASMAMASNASATQPYEDYSKHLESARNLSATGDGLMGESVSLYNGATEFTSTASPATTGCQCS
jgi:hypothetical protein